MTEIIGYIAAFLTTISFLPQVIKTLKTKDTTGISLLMYFIFTSGVFLWLIYGILLKNIVITSANLLTLVLAGMILLLKLRNEIKKWRPGSESNRRIKALQALALPLCYPAKKKRV